MNKFKTIATAILLVVFIGVFAVSAFLLGRYWLTSRQQANEYNDLADQVQQVQDQIRDDNYTPTAEVTISVVEGGEDQKTILPEYAGLYLQNTDMVGWICIPGTNINYPVMQSPEEPDYYLRRNFQKVYIGHGSVYVEEVCDVFKPSDNLTIYGHNMQDGSMFNHLHKYEKQSFWEDHSLLTFDTLLERHTYEIFSVLITTASVGEGFSYHQFVDAYNEEEYNDFVAECKRLSLYDTGITPTYGDKLISLSTCDYSVTNGRLVVVARRID